MIGEEGLKRRKKEEEMRTGTGGETKMTDQTGVRETGNETEIGDIGKTGMRETDLTEIGIETEREKKREEKRKKKERRKKARRKETGEKLDLLWKLSEKYEQCVSCRLAAL